ncbi:LysR family transcriptional regulator [Streptacidiphilus monticola]
MVAVAEAGGFTAAARRLHVVQSAVSGTVRALERELGVPLFERTSHRVALTAAGEAFLPAARAALQAAQQARAAAEAAGGELTGQLTIGVMQGVWLDLHEALAGLRRAHPRITVRLHQAAVADIRQALREGRVDAAVVALDSQQQRGLVVRQLAGEEMLLAASPTGLWTTRRASPTPRPGGCPSSTSPRGGRSARRWIAPSAPPESNATPPSR